MKMLKKEKLGEILIARKAISQEDLNEALTVQGANKRPLGEILVELGILSEKKLRENISAQLGIPFLDLTERYADPAKSGLKATVNTGTNNYDIVIPR